MTWSTIIYVGNRYSIPILGFISEQSSTSDWMRDLKFKSLRDSIVYDLKELSRLMRSTLYAVA